MKLFLWVWLFSGFASSIMQTIVPAFISVEGREQHILRGVLLVHSQFLFVIAYVLLKNSK